MLEDAYRRKHEPYLKKFHLTYQKNTGAKTEKEKLAFLHGLAVGIARCILLELVINNYISPGDADMISIRHVTQRWVDRLAVED